MAKIYLEVETLKNSGLKENVDFRVVYFSESAEIKFLGK